LHNGDAITQRLPCFVAFSFRIGQTSSEEIEGARRQYPRPLRASAVVFRCSAQAAIAVVHSSVREPLANRRNQRRRVFSGAGGHAAPRPNTASIGRPRDVTTISAPVRPRDSLSGSPL